MSSADSTGSKSSGRSHKEEPVATEARDQVSSRVPYPPANFTTVSGVPIQEIYTADNIDGFDPAVELGRPGEFPYTRGLHSDMYRVRLWTMRQFSGYGTPKETNRRLHYLLDQGQTGLSIAFDLPTLMGYDADHAFSEGEVGKCGVSISSLADMETLLAGLPLDRVTTSMTINSPAAMIWAMYLVAVEKQGIDWEKISGTTQNDILKEYIAQKEYIFPPKPSMRLVVDTLEFSSHHTPRWNVISISGYHIREAGSTALQELAFTLRNAIEYVEWCLDRGLAVDDFAPRLSFFFNAHNDLFEEIAKYRAARKVWAKVMQDRFGAKNPRSWLCRFHTQTAGCSLTAQQPYNNVMRTAIQALGGVLGGSQSLHTNSMDEAWALPTEEAATLALRTQQILAHETGITDTADPLGGSYFLEKLTLDMERGCFDYFDRIDGLGGMVEAVEKGFPQREIHEAAYAYQCAVEAKEKVILGVNAFADQGPQRSIDLLVINEEAVRHQRARLQKLRKTRDHRQVQSRLQALSGAAQGNENLMPYLLDCVRAYATLGEMCDTLRQIFGTYEEPAFR